MAYSALRGGVAAGERIGVTTLGLITSPFWEGDLRPPHDGNPDLQACAERRGELRQLAKRQVLTASLELATYAWLVPQRLAVIFEVAVTGIRQRRRDRDPQPAPAPPR